MADIPNPGLMRIRGAIQAMHDAMPKALAAIESVKDTETDLTAGVAALDLLGFVFPPAEILADVIKIAEALILLHALGLLHAGQPEDPAMARAAGH